jgi:molybdopterin-synthase adenylyltransferase
MASGPPSSSVRPVVKDFHRYDRQMLLPQIAAEGQKKLAAAKVLVVGCGGLGTNIADMLARAGVGHLVLADRDVVDVTNLQRQVLFDEADVCQGLPKAEAAKRKLAGINSQVAVTAVVDDVNHTNVEKLATGCDLILDGLDNFETRFLLNDCAGKLGLPYIYGGAVGTSGLVYPILPHTSGCTTPWETTGVAGPCLRCIFEQAPAPGSNPTCDTVGVLGPLVAVVGNLQVAEAIKALTGNWTAMRRSLLSLDLWANTIRSVEVSQAYAPGQCPCCGQRRFEYLEGKHASTTTTLCGRDAVQVAPTQRAPLDLPGLAARLRSQAEVLLSAYVLRATLTESGRAYELALFADGRAIIRGTKDGKVAKSLYAKFIGA